MPFPTFSPIQSERRNIGLLFPSFSTPLIEVQSFSSSSVLVVFSIYALRESLRLDVLSIPFFPSSFSRRRPAVAFLLFVDRPNIAPLPEITLNIAPPRL